MAPCIPLLLSRVDARDDATAIWAERHSYSRVLIDPLRRDSFAVGRVPNAQLSSTRD